MWKSRSRVEQHRELRGFTLLEVMVAVAIIAIGLTALLKSQAQGLSMATEARFATTAALLAQQKMAELEMTGFDHLQDGAGDFGEDFPGYRWQITSQPATLEGLGNVPDNLRQIDLEISWGEGHRSQYRYPIRYFHFSSAAGS